MEELEQDTTPLPQAQVAVQEETVLVVVLGLDILPVKGQMAEHTLETAMLQVVAEDQREPLAQQLRESQDKVEKELFIVSQAPLPPMEVEVAVEQEMALLLLEQVV